MAAGGLANSSAAGCPRDLAAPVPHLHRLERAGEHPAWDRYLARVYGGRLRPQDYPVDLDRFEWFYNYSPLGAHALAPTDPRCPLPWGTAWTGPDELYPERVATDRANGYFVQRYVEGSTPPPQPAQPMAWMEVMHTALGAVNFPKRVNFRKHLRADQKVGVWYWRTLGSGVFLSAGRTTRVVDGAADMRWTKDLPALRAEGVETVQAPLSVRNRGYEMRNQRFEIVDLRHGEYGSGGEEVGCVGEYRTGFAAERPCECNATLGYVNCRPRARSRSSIRSRKL